MFRLRAKKNILDVLEKEPLTSGSINVYDVAFEFSPAWDGLEKTVVFRAGTVYRSVLPDENGLYQIPWETLQSAGVWLYAGVCGMRGLEMVLPTIWVNLGLVMGGASVTSSGGGESPFDHRLLSHRDAEKQHPITAIDGLEEALKGIPTPMTAEQLRKILINGGQ